MPLKRFLNVHDSVTGLKPGVNEMDPLSALQNTQMTMY
jgi:hypothetical protein